MAGHSFFAFTRLTVLALVTTAAFAGGPWFRGGSSRGGYRGPVWSGGVRSGGVHVYAGGMVRVPPGGYMTSRYRGDSWYFGGGHWYRPWRGGYAAFYPPVGLCLSALPFGYATYVYRDIPYYYYEDIYYTAAPAGGYMVVDPPPEREERRPSPPPPSSSRQDPAADALLIIPKEGQKEVAMIADRQKAQRFAVAESGYDPTYSDPSDPGTPRARRAYLRAMKSYLEERGYSVK